MSRHTLQNQLHANRTAPPALTDEERRVITILSRASVPRRDVALLAVQAHAKLVAVEPDGPSLMELTLRGQVADLEKRIDKALGIAAEQSRLGGYAKEMVSTLEG